MVPSQDTTVPGGDGLALEGTGEDPEDGGLTGESLSWTSDVDGELGTGQSLQVTLSSDTTHQVVLTATDGSGASDADSVQAQVGAETTGSDTVPPELVTNEIVPDTVDVSTGPATVTVRARFTDDLSGVDRGSAQFLSPSGAQITSNFNLFRISGDEEDGVYEGSTDIPELAEAGTWTLTKLIGIDNAGNSRNFADELEGRGLPFELEVIAD